MKEMWKGEKAVKRTDTNGEVQIGVPKPESDEEKMPQPIPLQVELRESFQIQAALAEIGERMGLEIWLPPADRSRVLTKWNPEEESVLLEKLPLSYDQMTIKTIEQIDVLWLNRRSIVRAFEVEHTTSVFSGLLRMADLLALQPNMRIKLHIIAPESRREKVFSELIRPVFSFLEGGPLSKSRTYLSYDSIKDLLEEKHLAHLSDAVLDDFSENAE